MKTKTILSALVLIAAQWVAAASAVSLSSAAAVPPAPAKSDTLWIDVRSPAEYEQAHLPFAINIPLDAIALVLPQQEPNRKRPIALHCRSGNRSGKATAILTGLGYTAVRNAGGLKDVGL